MKIKRIHFEDNGQDFLFWDIAKNGVVVNCEPYQADIWKYSIVLNADKIRKRSRVVVLTTSLTRNLIIRHKIEKIEMVEYNKI